MRRQQIILFSIWTLFFLAVFIFLFAVAQASVAVRGDEVGRLWVWFGIVGGPIFAGMVATFIAEDKLRFKSKDGAGRFLFGLCAGLCGLYWVLVIANILSWNPDNMSFVSWLENQRLFLGILQGSLFALLAYFFTGVKTALGKQEAEGKGAEEE